MKAAPRDKQNTSQSHMDQSQMSTRPQLYILYSYICINIYILALFFILFLYHFSGLLCALC